MGTADGGRSEDLCDPDLESDQGTAAGRATAFEVFLPQDLATSMLSNNERAELARANRAVTKRVLCCACAFLASIESNDSEDSDDSKDSKAARRLLQGRADRAIQPPVPDEIGRGTPWPNHRQTFSHCGTGSRAGRGGEADACCRQPVSIIPSNTILYGTTICHSVAQLQLLGLSARAILELDQRYRIVWPWSIQYNADRVGNNKRLQFFPLLVVFPRRVRDVQFWVKFAKKYAITPSVCSGFHSYEAFGGSQPLVLNLTELQLSRKPRRVASPQVHRVAVSKLVEQGQEEDSDSIDKETAEIPPAGSVSNSGDYRPGPLDDFLDVLDRPGHLPTVRVTPGVRLGPLYTVLQQHGLILAGGVCPTVCIGGLVLGGGVGLFLRRYGFACDNLLSVDVVVADGSLVTATADNQHKDLFRALKGAGWAGLGIVVRLKFRVFRVPTVVFWQAAFPSEQGAKVLTHFQAFTNRSPKRFTGAQANLLAGVPLVLLSGIWLPPPAPVPNQALTTPVETEGVFWSDLGRYLLDGLLRAGIKPILKNASVGPFLEAATELGFEAPPLPFNKNRSNFVLEPIAFGALKDLVTNVTTAPVLDDQVLAWAFVAMRGTLTGDSSGPSRLCTSVLPARGALGTTQLAAYWSDTNTGAEFIRLNGAVYKSYQEYVSPFADPNVPDLDLVRYMDAYWGPQNKRFLMRVKRRYDPTNLFHFAQSISSEQSSIKATR